MKYLSQHDQNIVYWDWEQQHTPVARSMHSSFSKVNVALYFFQHSNYIDEVNGSQAVEVKEALSQNTVVKDLFTPAAE